jgi:hypothetical protein
MVMNFEVVHEKIGRLPGGEFSGTGKWDVYKVTLATSHSTASFIMALNDDEKTVEFQPSHPNDRKPLLAAFDAMLSYKTSRR